MAVLRHETWRFEDRMSSGVAGLENEAFDARLSGPGQCICVYYAPTHEAAMRLHYDHQGWGPYKPIPGVTDAPYTEEQLARQLADYPDDAELRALNGL